MIANIPTPSPAGMTTSSGPRPPVGKGSRQLARGFWPRPDSVAVHGRSAGAGPATATVVAAAGAVAAAGIAAALVGGAATGTGTGAATVGVGAATVGGTGALSRGAGAAARTGGAACGAKVGKLNPGNKGIAFARSCIAAVGSRAPSRLRRSTTWRPRAAW